MSKRDLHKLKPGKSIAKLVIEIDPTECPFREFRDNELHVEFWGMGPASFRTYSTAAKGGIPKPPADYVWVDEQTQPLPRSARQVLDQWVRAEDLAERRWDCTVVVAEESGETSEMLVQEYQLSHAQVLLRSSFCKRALSACFMLERAELMTVEHQWDSFIFNLPPEGWRAKCHIYSPGLKAGGGPQHKPLLSKNGCYLVRLYYLGAWRCVWVNDLVPVDANEAPLLPFSPLLSINKEKQGKKNNMISASVVYLWPMLICKALLKLAAPDMSSDENLNSAEDELLPEFDFMHCLLGGMTLTYPVENPESLWDLIVRYVPIYHWDDEEESFVSASNRTKSTKKVAPKENTAAKTKDSLVFTLLADTKMHAPYHLPGVTPGLEMELIIIMARDVPIKKPLPEPEVSLWKTFRWVDWARRHGLYDEYDCPRTRYLKVNGLMKLSYAPHLLDIQSTESITIGFLEIHKSFIPAGKGKIANKDDIQKLTQKIEDLKHELAEWMIYDFIRQLMISISIVNYPSMFNYMSAGNGLPVRLLKPTTKIIDITAPKTEPLYFQIDGPDKIVLRVSLAVLSPRVLMNSGVLNCHNDGTAFLSVERFEWFDEIHLPVTKGYLRTRGYGSIELKFDPGRHVCRLWVTSQMNWHVTLLTESELHLGPRDQVMSMAVLECEWTAKFLNGIGMAFNTWFKQSKSYTSITSIDRDVFKSYVPDATWDEEAIGYHQAFLHWMFQQAIRSQLQKKLSYPEYKVVCTALRPYFNDPDFGMEKKFKLQKTLRDIAKEDPCDCPPENLEEEEYKDMNEAAEITSAMLEQIADPRNIAQICNLATDDFPCEVLKEQREKIIRRHEAATIIQSYWRGTRARKCLYDTTLMNADVLKIINEVVFGSVETISSLMTEFFTMYPGTSSAYTVSSALRGLFGLQQYSGTTAITHSAKWVPYFQGLFYCHDNVKAHFDLTGSLKENCYAVYDNDTGTQLRQVFSAHMTFDLHPNNNGYTVTGHGFTSKTDIPSNDCSWQLTILTSTDNVFHCCDNIKPCRELPLSHARLFHFDEIYLPNFNRILGGIQISVTNPDVISFRVAASCPNLEMIATLRTTSPTGKMEIISKCYGKGEIYWPYIRLQPNQSHRPTSRVAFTGGANSLSSRSFLKMKGKAAKTSNTNAPEPKVYTIEVVAPSGWPLNIDQWKRVDEVLNSRYTDANMSDQKKGGKTTPGKDKSAKGDKNVVSAYSLIPLSTVYPDDAYVQLECSLTVGTGTTAKRDDDRDLEFMNIKKLWSITEPGRNARGVEIRALFREEYLEPSLHPASDHFEVSFEEGFEEQRGEQTLSSIQMQGPTPATEDVMAEEEEVQEEPTYLQMPEQLKDKFIPLEFLECCTLLKNEENPIILSPEMMEAAKLEREYQLKNSEAHMKELDQYNQMFILDGQKTRRHLLEKLYVDCAYGPELVEALEQRNDAIAEENLRRVLSAAKKKQDVKKGSEPKKDVKKGKK